MSRKELSSTCELPLPGLRQQAHLLSRVFLQVSGLALLAGEAVQAIEALLQGSLQFLLVGVSVFRGRCSKFLLEDLYLWQVGRET